MNELSMQEQETVLSLLRLGWSSRRVARETGHRPETITRYGRAAGILAPSPIADSKPATEAEVPTDSKPGSEAEVHAGEVAQLVRRASTIYHSGGRQGPQRHGDLSRARRASRIRRQLRRRQAVRAHVGVSHSKDQLSFRDLTWARLC